MKNVKRGFTLIELLVVVLIIGILAAVAVPQYQKTVEKARAMQAVVLVKAIADANELYYLTNATYADNLDVLDIKVSGEDYTNKYNISGSKMKDFEFFPKCAGLSNCVAASDRYDTDSNGERITLYTILRVANDPAIYCYDTNRLSYNVCQSLSGGETQTIQRVLLYKIH